MPHRPETSHNWEFHFSLGEKCSRDSSCEICIHIIQSIGQGSQKKIHLLVYLNDLSHPSYFSKVRDEALCLQRITWYQTAAKPLLYLMPPLLEGVLPSE